MDQLNRGTLLEQYAEQWIAVKNGRVIAGDPELAGLLSKLPDPAHTCVEFITREPLEMVLIFTYSPEDLKKLAVPTLFLVGSIDWISPPEIIREATAVLPRSQVVEISDTGHSRYFEAPSHWNQAVLRFLQASSALLSAPSNKRWAPNSGPPVIQFQAVAQFLDALVMR